MTTRHRPKAPAAENARPCGQAGELGSARARRMIVAEIDRIAANVRGNATPHMRAQVDNAVRYIYAALPFLPDSYFHRALRGAPSSEAAAKDVWAEMCGAAIIEAAIIEEHASTEDNDSVPDVTARISRPS